MQTQQATKKTLVLGASENPSRYSFLAINSLVKHGHPVVAIGKKRGRLGDVIIQNEASPEDAVDTVTLYLGALNQKPYYDYILSLKPKRVIFNPGAENLELKTLLSSNGIKPVEACTLVLLSTGQF